MPTLVNKCFVVKYCPKCGCYHPRLIKSGFANFGKQMLRCKECGKRFVVDCGQLTFYSHQDQSKWNELILDTLNGVSLKKPAAKINVNERNVFNMRHSGQLTFYSHQDQSKWNELILDTLNGVSLKKPAAKINVNERNVFNMRHKLLVSLGTDQLTFYSHQDQSKWNELILDTLNGVSLKKPAAKINVNERNVFNMRHKLLVSLGTEERPIHGR